jgi:hypothetical protein
MLLYPEYSYMEYMKTEAEMFLQARKKTETEV